VSSSSDVDLKLIRVASLLERDPAAAAREAAEIVRAQPTHRTALLLLAAAHRASADPATAAEKLGALAAAHPGSAVIHLELARALRAAGRDTEARNALERSLELSPDLAEGWRELSLLHAAAGDAIACDAAYARFEKLAPAESRHAEASAALTHERLDVAESLMKSALAHSAEDVVALRLLARVAAAREDYAQAERLLEQSLRLAPGYSRARLDLVKVLMDQVKGEPMLPLLDRLLTSDPRKPEYRNLQAIAYNFLGQTDAASAIQEGLLLECPDNENVWLNYGHTLRMAGRQSAAIDAYRKCLEINPGFGGAWVALANLKTYRFSAAEVAAMQTKLSQEDLPNEDRAQIEFSLGKALEDTGEYAGSFEHYARGNALRRAVVRYDAAAIRRFVERTRALCTREFFAARSGWGNASPEPIFIVGLPRTGSTLLEQILASHSQVEGTRELADVSGFALELGDREEPGRPPSYPQSLARLTRIDLAAFGERYIAQTRAYRALGRPRFIDKAGDNFPHIALIHLMLPNARIIDARRSGLGCCFANFKQHFYRGAWYSYSLEDLGGYYRHYVNLMTHFDAVLPGRIHRVNYEDLVGNLEGEVRRLLDYCGLPFEEQCLRFHETQRPVQTVSSEQVRQPLYKEGLEQWRNFEPWLGPLKAALDDLADAPGTRQANGS
jgi:tetratricopeptide (TPR) repeat protein